MTTCYNIIVQEKCSAEEPVIYELENPNLKKDSESSSTNNGSRAIEETKNKEPGELIETQDIKKLLADGEE